MWSYYGSKSKVVDLYPSPKFGKIIEPFAGSARYSLKYFEKDVLLVDKYPVIVEIWHYLQQASKQDILGLPRPKVGESIEGFNLSNPEKWLLGFLIVAGVSQPAKRVASFEGIGLNRNALENIANDLYKIRHWKVELGSYEDLPNVEATWFIDPPYQVGGEHYKMNSKQLNFYELGEWCKSRSGHVIVCENTKADWLPFKAMREMQGTLYKTTEAIWSNYPTDFDAQQMSLFAVPQLTPREPDSLKAGVLSLPDVVKSESNLPA